MLLILSNHNCTIYVCFKYKKSLPPPSHWLGLILQSQKPLTQVHPTLSTGSIPTWQSSSFLQAKKNIFFYWSNIREYSNRLYTTVLLETYLHLHQIVPHPSGMHNCIQHIYNLRLLSLYILFLLNILKKYKIY